MRFYAIKKRPRRPWGATICDTGATFVSSWEGQRSGVLRTPRLDLAASWGLRYAKMSQLSVAPGRSGGVVSYTQIRMRPRGP